MSARENKDPYEESLMAEDELYKEHILDHYQHPHNKGRIEKPTFHYRELNPLCGDEVEMFVEIKDGKVKKVSWEGKGCAISQAATSLLTEELMGKTIEELNKITTKNLLDLLGIPIGPVRLKCANLPLRTLQLAMLEMKVRI